MLSRPVGRRFIGLGLVTAATAYVLIVLGGILRITGGDLGCPDWPQCQGQWTPPLEPALLVEYSHRVVAGVLTVLLAAMAAVAWRHHRAANWIILPVTLALVMQLCQVLLGGVTVLFDSATLVVAAHFGTALLLLSLVLTATVAAAASHLPRPALGDGAALQQARLFSRHAAWTLGLTFALLLTGAAVTAAGATLACPDLPICAEGWTGASRLAEFQMVHRVAALSVMVLLIALAGRGWALRHTLPGLGATALASAALVGAQSVVGAAGVLASFPPAAQALHLALAAATWAGVSMMTIIAWLGVERLEAAQPAAASAGSGAAARRAQVAGTVRAYVALMKPRIIVLLLITTFGAMVLAQGGMPPLHLIVFTLLGGTLAAGGANAINQYLDRDIDELMRRTRRRPLPSHQVPPQRALAFGITLGVLAFALMATLVNLLAAVLSITGLLFYVIVYTIWLKRTTPQNIVIGGAAGAIPPLVGWAAVTGTLTLPALYLFAIIFFWTPPHFWALSLLLKNDYAAARVPMLPVISGEAETKRQILLYSVLLVAVTLLMFAGRLMGVWYLLGALVLGGLLIWHALKLARGADQQALARRLFFYTNAYLALLFVAMILDRVVLPGSLPTWR